MLPPLPQFFPMMRGVTWQHSRKKLGERAGVKGPFNRAAILESPLIRPGGHLLPKGEKGVYFSESSNLMLSS